MTVTIDRFEDGHAVCLRRGGRELRLDVSALPNNIREGSILRFDGSRWTACPVTESIRLRSIRKKLDVLLRRK